jgi:steroid delta-isomerase-like uncharacterized protein
MLEPSDYPRLAEAAFNGRDLAALAALWVPDVHYRAPGEETRTRDAALARERALIATFPDVRADLRRFVAAESRLLIEGRLHGTHDGPLRLGASTLAPTGRAVVVSFVGAFEFEAGRIQRERVYYDRLELLEQLGVVPAEAGR